MLASELIATMQQMVKINGDFITEDSDGFPIEEVSFYNHTDVEDRVYTLYSEGDDH